MSHVSIEIGHFSMEELANGEARIAAQLRRVAPLVRVFADNARAEFAEAAGGHSDVRVSTCFLVDDYFRGDTDPRVILPKFLRLVEQAGIQLDYVGRESGCARVPLRDNSSSPIELARVVADMVVAAPLENYNGRRPPTSELGWLSNGRRSSDDEPSYATDLRAYVPPKEHAARNHSVFLDVEMWSRKPGDEEIFWSCPFLASVWQLLRLGMVRYIGQPVAEPVKIIDWAAENALPDRWDLLPTVMQVREKAAPFAAFQSLSILPKRYLGIEHSVQQILDHVNIESGVHDVYELLARQNNIDVTRNLSDRLAHYFLPTYKTPPEPDPAVLSPGR